jgi:hypothetical protein
MSRRTLKSALSKLLLLLVSSVLAFSVGELIIRFTFPEYVRRSARTSGLSAEELLEELEMWIDKGTILTAQR